MTWAAIDNGTYAHVFTKLDKPFKLQGRLVQWASICSRAFAFEAPQPNAKKKKCRYCVDKENGHHGNN